MIVLSELCHGLSSTRKNCRRFSKKVASAARLAGDKHFALFASADRIRGVSSDSTGSFVYCRKGTASQSRVRFHRFHPDLYPYDQELPLYMKLSQNESDHRFAPSFCLSCACAKMSDGHDPSRKSRYMSVESTLESNRSKVSRPVKQKTRLKFTFVTAHNGFHRSDSAFCSSPLTVQIPVR
jgi:hypothetical protein